jgi:2-keto-4-pentenoate hydratase/2-oxohepta-3-ene-1,7-dioic acid hydratase in catechol pathway
MWLALWLALLLIATLLAYSHFVSRPLFTEVLLSNTPGDVIIAPSSEALTFARTREALLLVTSIEAGIVRGINLTQRYDAVDPLEVYRDLGFDQLQGMLSKITRDDELMFETELNQLLIPISSSPPHLAAGTNYAEHAEEVYLDDPPFLFPKLSELSSWQSTVPGQGSRLLDYEAELCMVPLGDATDLSDSVEFGLILCNDFTDRWLLLREISLDQPMGTTGFAAAKGKAGFLPMGFLFVIPRDQQFYQQIEMQLFVNGSMRQRFIAGDMILKPEDIIRQALGSNDMIFYRGDKVVSLLAENKVHRGSLILTGTAAGVIFKPVNVWNPWYYLQSGDLVVTRGTYLGYLNNPIQ